MTTVLIGEKGKKLRIVRQNVTMKNCLTNKRHIVNIPDILSQYMGVCECRTGNYTVYSGIGSAYKNHAPYYSAIRGESYQPRWTKHHQRSPRAIVVVCDGNPVNVPLELIVFLGEYMQDDPAYRVLKTRVTCENDVINI